LKLFENVTGVLFLKAQCTLKSMNFRWTGKWSGLVPVPGDIYPTLTSSQQEMFCNHQNVDHCC